MGIVREILKSNLSKKYYDIIKTYKDTEAQSVQNTIKRKKCGSQRRKQITNFLAQISENSSQFTPYPMQLNTKKSSKSSSSWHISIIHDQRELWFKGSTRDPRRQACRDALLEHWIPKTLRLHSVRTAANVCRGSFPTAWHHLNCPLGIPGQTRLISAIPAPASNRPILFLSLLRAFGRGTLPSHKRTFWVLFKARAWWIEIEVPRKVVIIEVGCVAIGLASSVAKVIFNQIPCDWPQPREVISFRATSTREKVWNWLEKDVSDYYRFAVKDQRTRRWHRLEDNW